MDSASPGTSCIVYRLRAAAHSGGPKGQQHDQFTVTVNGTVLTADLSADFQGDFSAVTKPNFDSPAAFRLPEWAAMAVFLGVVGLIMLFAWVLVATSHLHH